MVWSQLGEASGNALDFAPSASNGFLGNIGSNLSGAFNGATNFLNNNAKGLGTLGQLYGAYNQYNMGNKIYDMQKNAFDYNKMLSEEERKRRDQQDANFSQGFANSSYGKA